MIKKTVGADNIRPKKGFPEGSIPPMVTEGCQSHPVKFSHSAFPWGKVAKPKVLTDEGKTRSSQDQPHFFGTVKTVPYGGAAIFKNRADSLPCAKGGVANGDGGIVIPSR